jgi:hypothetical protein
VYGRRSEVNRRVELRRSVQLVLQEPPEDPTPEGIERALLAEENQ